MNYTFFLLFSLYSLAFVYPSIPWPIFSPEQYTFNPMLTIFSLPILLQINNFIHEEKDWALVAFQAAPNPFLHE